MNKRILSIILVLAMLVGMFAIMPVGVGAEEEWSVWDGSSYDVSFFSDGTGAGTAENPYKISSAAQWVGFVKWSNGLEVDAQQLTDFVCFELTKNLKFNEGDAAKWVNEAPKNVLEPAFDFYTYESTVGYRYGVKFNGKGHTISGVYMNDAESGLFGVLWGQKNVEETSSVVENLVLENSCFDGAGWMGSIVSETGGSTIIRNIYVAKDVYINSTGNVNGGILGGCAAKNKKDTYDVTINDCVFAGVITSTGNSNAGIIGSGNSNKTNDKIFNVNISNCLVLGSISSTSTSERTYTNGFIGNNAYSSKNTIVGCIYAGQTFKEYPFGETVAKESTLTVENSYTTVWGKNNAAYITENSIEKSDGVTLITVDQLIGCDASIVPAGWSKVCTDGETPYNDIIVPSGVASFAPLSRYAQICTTKPSWKGKSGDSWADAYEIDSAKMWNFFVEQSKTDGFSGKYIKLTADITLNEGDAKQWAETGVFDGVANEPVNSGRYYNDDPDTYPNFNGNFDGQGYTISGAYIVENSGADGIGLFGEVGTATIKNLRIKNSYFEGEDYVGGLIGEACGAIKISNVYVDSDVYIHARQSSASKNAASGGIVGCLYGDNGSGVITGCVFAGTLTSEGGTYIAGILGKANTKPTEISDCLFLGSVSGGENASGIVSATRLSSGSTTTYTATRCVSIGYAQNAITNNKGTSRYISVSSSYAVGDGLVSSFKVFGTDIDTKITDKLNPDGANNWTVREDDYIIPSGVSKFTTFSIDGIEEWATEYEISNASEWKYFTYLGIMGTTFKGETIKLMADIDFGGEAILPVAPDSISKFEGTFDGQNFILSNFRMNCTNDAASLLGDIGDGAVVKNLAVKNATYNVNQWAGAVVGEVSGTATVENIYVADDVTINGVGELGGIVGGLYSNGNLTIKNCVFAGTVIASGATVGGIVGRGNALTVLIEDCLMLGAVYGADDASGIIGWNKDKEEKVGDTTVIKEGSTTIRNTVYAGKNYDMYAFGSFNENITIENCYMTTGKSLYACRYNDNNNYMLLADEYYIELYDLVGKSPVNGWIVREGDISSPASAVGNDTLLKLYTYDGASVRFSEPSGIRFTAIIGEKHLDSFKGEGKDVSFGILITPTSYITEAGGEFTVDALSKLKYNTSYLEMAIDLADSKYLGGEGQGFYQFNGVLTNLLDPSKAFSARAYIKVVEGDTTTYYYADYSEAKNSRSIVDVAKMAYEDTFVHKKLYYNQEIDESGVYSPYSKANRDMLLEIRNTNALEINFLSYNIRNVEDEAGNNWWSGDKATFEYDNRNQYVLEYLLNSGADIIGLQEVAKLTVDNTFGSDSTLDWFDTIGDDTRNTGLMAADYGIVKGDDLNADNDPKGKDMYNPIYYKKDKFKVVSSDTIWFTDADSRYEASYIPCKDNSYKALNYVVFEVLDENGEGTGVRFVYVNLHLIVRRTNYILDSNGNVIGAVTENGTTSYSNSHFVQELEVIYLREILEELQTNEELATYDLPMFIGGDFNNSYSAITGWFKSSVTVTDETGAITDIKTIDPKKESLDEKVTIDVAREAAISKADRFYSCTTDDFTQINPEAIEENWGAIDLWFTSNFDGVVHTYRILDNKTTTTTGEKYPSDHLPAQMVVTLYY